jgi:hypothetical protein
MYGVTFHVSSKAMSSDIGVSICKAEVEPKLNDLTIVMHRKIVARGVDADFLTKRVSIPGSSTSVASVPWMLIPSRHRTRNQTDNTSIQSSEEVPVERVTGADVSTTLHVEML